MTPDRLIKLIEGGFLDRKLAGIYGTDATEAQRARYISLLGEFLKRYGDERDVALFSVPGRSELSGNHTDHNHGKILAAAVSIDIIAVAAPSRGSLIRVKRIHRTRLLEIRHLRRPDRRDRPRLPR